MISAVTYIIFTKINDVIDVLVQHLALKEAPRNHSDIDAWFVCAGEAKRSISYGSGSCKHLYEGLRSIVV